MRCVHFCTGTSCCVWTTSSMVRPWQITSSHWCRGRSRSASSANTTALSPLPSTSQVQTPRVQHLFIRVVQYRPIRRQICVFRLIVLHVMSNNYRCHWGSKWSEIWMGWPNRQLNYFLDSSLDSHDTFCFCYVCSTALTLLWAQQRRSCMSNK